MMRGSIRKQLVLVEDDEVLCNLLKECLQQEGYCVITLSAGEGIPGVMKHSSPVLIVLDLMLPGKNGIYWLEWLKAYYPAIPVIIMSAKAQAHERLQGLELGAKDYLVKPFYDKELLIRVDNLLSALSGGSGGELVRIGRLTLDRVNCKVITDEGREIALTVVEFKILQMLCLNAGILVSREDLVEQLLEIPYNPINRTIDTHISRIRAKIEIDPATPAYIRTVRGKGYYVNA